MKKWDNPFPLIHCITIPRMSKFNYNNIDTGMTDMSNFLPQGDYNNIQFAEGKTYDVYVEFALMDQGEKARSIQPFGLSFIEVTD